jgi:C4-dicarboxylate-specific signal transduction histidine kinase
MKCHTIGGPAMGVCMSEYEQKEIEFFGKITAGSTHEMKNVLAIIKESSGLMEDLMALSQDTPMPHREKFQSTLSVIKNQVQRGTEISDRLNRFAHSTDAQVDKIDLHAAAEHLIFLAQRFARLKNVVLKTDPPSVPMTVLVRPVRLLMTLFGCIECCLNILPPGSEIHLGVRKTDGGFALSVSCKGDVPPLSPLPQTLSTGGRWPDLKGIAESLGGSIELDAEDPCIRLYLPETPA